MRPLRSLRDPWLGRLADAGALLALLIVGLARMPRGGGEGLPRWATPRDLLLDGPDAGAWALNALLVSAGEPGATDPNRMPTFLLLTAFVHQFQPDIALAGHLVGRLAFLALPLVGYGLGRAGGGPAVGLLAGLLILGCAPLEAASRRFGVDPAVAVLLPLGLLAALSARRRWWLSGPAGIAAGLAAATHFTAIPYVLPAALAIALRGPAGLRARLAALALFAAGVLAAYLALSAFFPLVTLQMLAHAVSEGVAPAGDRLVVEPGLSDAAHAQLKSGLSSALSAALPAALSPFGRDFLPAGLLAILLGLGALGPGLGPDPSAKPASWGLAPAIRRRLHRAGLASLHLRLERPLAALADRARAAGRAFDLGLGLPLLACLAPLPFLAAAGAEPRYAANLLPFVAILLARGAASAPATIELALRRQWPSLPRGLLASPLVVLALASTPPRLAPEPPDQLAIDARALGALLEARFPGPGGAACPIREALAHAGRQLCPPNGCVSEADEAGFAACIRELRRTCEGEGPIPYVIVARGPLGMGDGPFDQAMGAWAKERFPAATEQAFPRFHATILSIPREE